MKAKISVEVKGRKQAHDLEAGLARPDVRAFAIVMGVLDTLPSKRAQERVLRFVADHFADSERSQPPEPPPESARLAAVPRRLRRAL